MEKKRTHQEKKAAWSVVLCYVQFIIQSLLELSKHLAQEDPECCILKLQSPQTFPPLLFRYPAFFACNTMFECITVSHSFFSLPFPPSFLSLRHFPSFFNHTRRSLFWCYSEKERSTKSIGKNIECIVIHEKTTTKKKPNLLSATLKKKKTTHRQSKSKRRS